MLADRQHRSLRSPPLRIQGAIAQEKLRALAPHVTSIHGYVPRCKRLLPLEVLEVYFRSITRCVCGRTEDAGSTILQVLACKV
jgi:hypothetical protein